LIEIGYLRFILLEPKRKEKEKPATKQNSENSKILVRQLPQW
jgi:hypothetical protein